MPVPARLQVAQALKSPVVLNPSLWPQEGHAPIGCSDNAQTSAGEENGIATFDWAIGVRLPGNLDAEGIQPRPLMSRVCVCERVCMCAHRAQTPPHLCAGVQFASKGGFETDPCRCL